MLINKIRLNNYRNYQSFNLEFDSGLNIIVGPNGIGKTNILESLIVVSNTHSFRLNNDRDLIKKNEEYGRIELESDKGLFRVVINKEGKSLYINNNNIKKASAFIGKINCILFKPSDLELFNQSPKERRKILDIEIGKVSPEYLNALLSYNSLLKDRNRLLKENSIDNIYLDLLDEQMLPHMRKIIEGRKYFFEQINKYFPLIFQKMAADNNEVSIIYEPCAEESELQNLLKRNREKDLYYHYTVAGIHHEDYHFLYNSYDLATYASQGQKRMVLLSFKLALFFYIRSIIKESPIILLDDIFSELDSENRKRLLQILPKNTQIIITDTTAGIISENIGHKLINLKGV